MAVSSSTVLRVRGLPSDRNIDEITSLLGRSLQIRPDAFGLKITSLAEDPYRVNNQVATLMFLRETPPRFTTSNTHEWSSNVSEADHGSESEGDQILTFDTHFHGLTALNTPRVKEEAVDCIAVCGLGGHAFGSFKEKGTSYMWLRDSLPKDMPNLRVLLYGYESGLDGSDSNQNVSVIADSFTVSTPLIIIAHSLGGLVVKQAIIKLGRGNQLDKRQMESVVGLLFFGVPNRGMDIESLQTIVGNRQNRYLLESVGQYSDLLLQQDGEFGPTFHFEDSKVVSFFETKSSPTAVQVNGSWKMQGPPKVLVTRFSATRPRLWESDDEALNRTHSDLVKFSTQHSDYERVVHRLREIASEAAATLTSRYLQSSHAMNTDEEACLRSLSFAGIYAREDIIDPAVQDTGSWLLEGRNFDDWLRRRRLDEHRGFFWIQGNPGSGKSTLMKKVYSHVTARPQDPTSVVAAFFFNARGNEIEQSPMGLFRTLLHTLCQQISALRDLVVKAYVSKRRLLSSGWQWQFNELKELLAAVVTSSVLGQRSLLLFVDALDECDLAATQSVIHMFEDLASSSFAEHTHFNICLSSRYWPQFRIQHCFIARVELENKDDIIRYIQKHMDLSLINEEDVELLADVRAEILDKAKGTFLWVVLIVRELLSANIAGATLGELRNIVQKVPPDLGELYQQQLQKTKSKDRDYMLRILQLVFYAQRPLSPTDVRYALAFGSRAYASHAEWSQSNEYVRSDEQMEKRIREYSKGLVEVAPLARSSEAVVQFIHQSVRDFLTADGFSFLRDPGWRTHSADGHEFLKSASFNYFRTKEIKDISVVDLRVSQQLLQVSISADHPFLEYMVLYIFPHAAQAEKNGVPQDSFRTDICSNIQGCFERWKSLHDSFADFNDMHGRDARPIHVLASYGLLTRDIAKTERNIDIADGDKGSALVAACYHGHQDAVNMLLDLGADPRYSSGGGLTTFEGAASHQNLPVLSQLLNGLRVPLTLQERLDVARSITSETPHLGAFLALLFSEATIPNSAIDDLCEAARWSTPGVLSFLLNKSDCPIVQEEKLWHAVLGVGYSTQCLSKIRTLLDHGGTVVITNVVVDILKDGILKDGQVTTASKILSLLLELCEVEMTEDLVDSICSFQDSSQIVRLFETAGYCFDPFTSRQLGNALYDGSAETVAFFLQRQDGNMSADEMFDSALSNEVNGGEVTRLVLGYLNPDHVTEQAIMAALENESHDEDVIRVLHSRWSSLTFSEAALAVAVKWQRGNVVKFVLERCDCARITEDIMNAAVSHIKAPHSDTATVLDLLLLHDPNTRVQESTVIRVCKSHYQESSEILDVFRRHGKPLMCTENVVDSLADSICGSECLEIVLQQTPEAKISSSMITRAMRAVYGAALISVMLQHDDTIVINDEHLTAAASNPYDPSTIFAFLQTKGKLNHTEPASEAVSSNPAKRRRVSPKSPPRISTEVINAAFSNPRERARERLLTLFLEWNVITTADYNDRFSVAAFDRALDCLPTY